MSKPFEKVTVIGTGTLGTQIALLGFCFNRVWRAIKREGLWMWGNGYVDFRDVDRTWMTFTKMKMGTFGIMDGVGLDVWFGILKQSIIMSQRTPKISRLRH